jgi:hypothetical protein
MIDIDAELNDRARLGIGIATFWPAFYAVLFAIFWLISVSAQNQPGRGWALAEFAMKFLHTFTVLLVCSVGGIFFVWLFQDDQLDTREKVKWAALLIVLFPVTMPMFYFRFLHPERRAMVTAVGPVEEEEDDEEEAVEVWDVE